MMNVSMSFIEILHEWMDLLDSENLMWEAANRLMENGIFVKSEKFLRSVGFWNAVVTIT